MTKTDLRTLTDTELRELLEHNVICTTTAWVGDTEEWKCENPAEFICVCVDCGAHNFKCSSCLDGITRPGVLKWWTCRVCHIHKRTFLEVFRVVGKV